MTGEHHALVLPVRRWPRSLNAAWAIFPDGLLRALGNGSGELSVLHALGSHANDNLEYSASVRCLAAMAELSERQTIVPPARLLRNPEARKRRYLLKSLPITPRR